MIDRRAMLMAGLLAGMARPLWGQTRPKPRPDLRMGMSAGGGGGAGAGRVMAQIGDLIDQARLGGQISLAVADRATGSILAEIDMHRPLPPASVTKAVTALFALDGLGAGTRLTTRLLATGPLQGDVLQGDLVLAGGGDASLDTDRLGDMAAALAQRGLRRITGRFLIWGGALPLIDRIDPDQPEYVGYNPTISGAMLNFNRAQFVWALQNGQHLLAVNAEGARFNPAVRAIEVVADARDAPLFRYLSRTPRERWSVAIPALNAKGSRWLPVRNPSAYLGDVFATLAAAHGIDLPPALDTATLPAPAMPLVQDQSAPLTQLLADMLRYSTNLTAESLGLAASGAGDLAQSGQVMAQWAAARFGGAARFVDHSGLGAASSCTPHDMMQIFLRAKGLQALLRPRRIDQTGREAKEGALQVWAKSGTLNFTSNLAGYVQGPRGGALVFTIFVADPARRAALPMDQREDPPGGAAWTKRARKLHRQIIALCAQEWA